MKKVLDRILMVLFAAFWVWLIIVFIGDAIEANRPAEQAIAHSASELSLYYGGVD